MQPSVRTHTTHINTPTHPDTRIHTSTYTHTYIHVHSPSFKNNVKYLPNETSLKQRSTLLLGNIHANSNCFQYSDNNWHDSHISFLILFTRRLLTSCLLLLSRRFDRCIFPSSSGACLTSYPSGNFELNHFF